MSDQLRLRMVSVTMLLFLAAMLAVWKRPILWPLITWPMYSTREYHFPESEFKSYQVDIIGTSGLLRRVSTVELLSSAWDDAADTLVSRAIRDPVPERRSIARNHLTRLARHVVPRDSIVSLEIYEVVWEVDPLALPPLDRDKPTKRTLLATIEARATRSLQPQ